MRIMPLLSASLVALVLSGCVEPQLQTPVSQSRPAAATQRPLVITEDRGGNVLAAIARRNQLEASGRPVEIRGYCASACTLLTTLPNACLGPKAVIGFHAPRLPNTQVIPPVVDQMMANYYRNGILRRWNAEWKHELKMTRISAREYVALDPETRICRN